MTLAKIMFGLAILVLAAGFSYYHLLIVLHLREHEEMSLARIFVDQQTPGVFQVLMVSGLLYVIGSSIVAVGELTHRSLGAAQLYIVLPKLLTLIAMLGLLWFLQRVAHITARPSADDGLFLTRDD